MSVYPTVYGRAFAVHRYKLIPTAAITIATMIATSNTVSPISIHLHIRRIRRPTLAMNFFLEVRSVINGDFPYGIPQKLHISGRSDDMHDRLIVF
jgi:hypothetical protein